MDFIKSQVFLLCGFISRPFHSALPPPPLHSASFRVCVCVCQCHAVFFLWLCSITWNQLLWSPSGIVFTQDCLPIGNFCACIWILGKVFFILFSIFVKNDTGILMRITLTLYIALGSIAPFFVFIRLSQKCRMSSIFKQRKISISFSFVFKIFHWQNLYLLVGFAHLYFWSYHERNYSPDLFLKIFITSL